MILSDKTELDPALEFLREKPTDSKYLEISDGKLPRKKRIRKRSRLTSILLEQDLYDFLHAIAAQERMSFNSVVHDILRNFVEKVLK